MEVRQTSQTRPDPTATTRDVVAATISAARSGKPWPGVAAITAAATAVAEHDLRRQILDRARQELGGTLGDLIVTSAEEILTAYLRPVHDRLAATFVAAGKLIPEAPSTDALMRASDKVRKAWLDLDDSAATCARVRDTAERLNRFTPAQHDVHGEYAMVRNLLDVWPEWQVGRTPPWQSNDPRLTYLWLARHGADLWLPTSAERDAAWWASHGEAVDRAKHHRGQLEGFRGLMSR